MPHHPPYCFISLCPIYEAIYITPRFTMVPKCSSASTGERISKRQRKSISLEEKRKIIELFEGGKRGSAIGRELGMPRSTINTILKSKERILRAVQESALLKATRITKVREGPITEMENLLMSWIEDQTRKGTPLRPPSITAKAKNLFKMLKVEAGEGYTIEFLASSGWFRGFVRRSSLHHVQGRVRSGCDTATSSIPA